VETRFVDQTQLRTRLARELSQLYATEVPAYQTLVDVSREVNQAVLAQGGADAERLGSVERVTEERHGAIRVGTPREMGQIRRIFAAAGMVPVGFYDLRDGAVDPVPVVSTAFRPIDQNELARNPFRVFTSMLTPGDRRFFDRDLEQQLRAFLGRRRLFPDELLALADRSIAEGGLSPTEADDFLTLARSAFALSREPADKAWYDRLAAISSVAADIGGTTRTHINHLTPRVLDIDALYAKMTDRGITMIDRIQGPPRWHGPDVLLRQTSFRALEEARLFRRPDGEQVSGTVRVRFGEVESRGVALTRAGRDLYDTMIAEVDERLRGEGGDYADIARKVWEAHLPATDNELAISNLAFFRYEPTGNMNRPATEPTTLDDLLAAGLIDLHPIVYEDFLPRSAAGIFASNLANATTVNAEGKAENVDQDWLSGALGVDIIDPLEQYATQRDASVATCAGKLEIDPEVFATR
jgi:uncharacterized glyoxalase superfamily metalloenzyme YdcJ